MGTKGEEATAASMRQTFIKEGLSTTILYPRLNLRRLDFQFDAVKRLCELLKETMKRTYTLEPIKIHSKRMIKIRVLMSALEDLLKGFGMSLKILMPEYSKMTGAYYQNKLEVMGQPLEIIKKHYELLYEQMDAYCQVLVAEMKLAINSNNSNSQSIPDDDDCNVWFSNLKRKWSKNNVLVYSKSIVATKWRKELEDKRNFLHRMGIISFELLKDLEKCVVRRQYYYSIFLGKGEVELFDPSYSPLQKKYTTYFDHARELFECILKECNSAEPAAIVSEMTSELLNEMTNELLKILKVICGFMMSLNIEKITQFSDTRDMNSLKSSLEKAKIGFEELQKEIEFYFEKVAEVHRCETFKCWVELEKRQSGASSTESSSKSGSSGSTGASPETSPSKASPETSPSKRLAASPPII